MAIERPVQRHVRDRHEARNLFAAFATAPREVAAFAFLDPEWRLLGMRHTTAGDTGSVEVPLRLIARDAVIFDASNVIMAHNHPAGEATPSSGDIDATRRIARALGAIDVRLIDHLVLARDGCVSLRELKYL